MAEEKAFMLKIISPDRLFYEGEVLMVEARTTEGEIGVLKGHIPLTSVLVPGVVRISEAGGDVKLAAVHGGFVEILQDSMTILAEVSEWPEEIDLNRAKEAKIRAERRLAEKAAGVNLARAELALQRSVARIEALGK